MITLKITGGDETARKIAEYVRYHGRKTFPEACNAKMLDASYRALKLTERANTSEITNLPLRSWWPKYIAKRLSQGEGVQISRKAGAITRFVFGTKKYKDLVKGRFTKADAKKASAVIIAARKRSITFLAAGWLGAIQALRQVVPASDRPKSQGRDAQQRGKPKGYGVPANLSDLFHPVAKAGNTSMNPKHNPQPYRSLAIARAGADAALKETLADIQVYLRRKMIEAGKIMRVPLK